MPIVVDHGPNAGLLAGVSYAAGDAKGTKEAQKVAFQQAIQAQNLAIQQAENNRAQQRSDQATYWDSPVGRFQSQQLDLNGQLGQAQIESALQQQRYEQQMALQQSRQEQARQQVQQGLKEGALKYTPSQKAELTRHQEAYSRVMGDPSLSQSDKQAAIGILGQKMQSIMPVEVPPNERPIKPIERFEKTTALVTNPQTGQQHYVGFDRNGVPKPIEFPDDKGAAQKQQEPKPITLQDKIASDPDYRHKMFQDANKTLMDQREAEYKKKSAGTEGTASIAPPKPPSNDEVFAEVQRRLDLDKMWTARFGVSGGQVAGQQAGAAAPPPAPSGLPVAGGPPAPIMLTRQAGHGGVDPRRLGGMPAAAPGAAPGQPQPPADTALADNLRAMGLNPNDPKVQAALAKSTMQAPRNAPLDDSVPPGVLARRPHRQANQKSAEAMDLMDRIEQMTQGAPGLTEAVGKAYETVRKVGKSTPETSQEGVESLVATYQSPEPIPSDKRLLVKGLVYSVKGRRAYWDGDQFIVLQ